MLALATEEAQAKFAKLVMKDKDIDLYMAEFEENLGKVRWSRTDFSVIQKFQDGLQKWIVSNILNWDVWQETLEE